MGFINSILSFFTQKRLAQIEYFKNNPVEVQRETLKDLLSIAANTKYGKKYDFASILTPEQYRECLPVVCYEDQIHIRRTNTERRKITNQGRCRTPPK